MGGKGSRKKKVPPRSGTNGQYLFLNMKGLFVLKYQKDPLPKYFHPGSFALLQTNYCEMVHVDQIPLWPSRVLCESGIQILIRHSPNRIAHQDISPCIMLFDR